MSSGRRLSRVYSVVATVAGVRWAETTVAVPGAALWTASAGTGVPLVLAHGGPGLSNTLFPVGEMVGDLARVHLYDQRGCGRSSTGGPYDVATAIADLEALREHFGHARWLVGGHSWGAALALFYALEHPERTLGVVYLAGTSIRWDFPDRVRAARMARLTPDERAELDGEPDEGRFLQLIWTTDFATREAAEAALARGPLYEHPRNMTASRATQRDWKRRLDAGIEDDLRALDVPILVLHGEHDPDPVGARAVADLAPRGAWAPIAHAGHSPWHERPDELRDRLRPFVAERLRSLPGETRR
jgi:proline iminopeptidase